jgi:outer membrane protein
MKKIILFLFAFHSLLQIGFSQDTIAVADMNRVFNEYYKTKNAEANLKEQAEIFKKYAENLNESFKKLQEEFKELRDASQNIAISEVERESKRLAAQDKYRQLKEKEIELKNYSDEKQEQIKKKYAEVRENLLAEIKAVIDREAAKKGYTLVLDISGKTLNQIPAVISYKKELDITENILNEINALSVKEKLGAKNEKPDTDKINQEPQGKKQ